MTMTARHRDDDTDTLASSRHTGQSYSPTSQPVQPGYRHNDVMITDDTASQRYIDDCHSVDEMAREQSSVTGNECVRAASRRHDNETGSLLSGAADRLMVVDGTEDGMTTTCLDAGTASLPTSLDGNTTLPDTDTQLLQPYSSQTNVMADMPPISTSSTALDTSLSHRHVRRTCPALCAAEGHRPAAQTGVTACHCQRLSGVSMSQSAAAAHSVDCQHLMSAADTTASHTHCDNDTEQPTGFK